MEESVDLSKYKTDNYYKHKDGEVIKVLAFYTKIDTIIIHDVLYTGFTFKVFDFKDEFIPR